MLLQTAILLTLDKLQRESFIHVMTTNNSFLFLYPDEEQIISQLGKIELLRVGGFHTYDCCSRVARRAYEKGMDVLVDEDLTQFFPLVFEHSHFKIDDYPLVNPRDEIIRQHLWELFLANRRNKPWFIQNFD